MFAAKQKTLSGGVRISAITSEDANWRAARCLSWMAFVSQRYILNESPYQRRHFWMKDGDMPASSSRTQAQTRRDWAEYFLRSSAEVDGCTFFTALQRSVAFLLPVMNSNRAFLVLYRRLACCPVMQDGGLSWPFAVLPGQGILRGSFYPQKVYSSGRFDGSSGCARWSVRMWLSRVMSQQFLWGHGRFCHRRGCHWQWTFW